ncbi:hypothetical protein A2567_02695 [Candidatus Azambacteria bacterium RIFOXYD1_FULL_42_11]|uniref:Uncharacterized protein n=1 Tax=Candidatus Azambacteria bacterium RIFOXYD1_FULL_42_11 TaxID=1797310 RepID=A0A1F5CGG5_9BACT|nr:MAG: hypothetical protein A2567_02695 [Candidatus Azambacteria bacterium RIFOXYD1_FULL_42_11]
MPVLWGRAAAGTMRLSPALPGDGDYFFPPPLRSAAQASEKVIACANRAFIAGSTSDRSLGAGIDFGGFLGGPPALALLPPPPGIPHWEATTWDL